MPKKVSLPTLGFHKATGQARCYVNGKSVYLGPYGAPDTTRKYGELIARIAAGLPVATAVTTSKDPDQGPSVAEVCLSFWTHAQTHYVKNGKPTSEIEGFRSCLRIVRSLYGESPAKKFGPLALKAVRAAMVEGDPKAKDSKGNLKPRKPWSRTVCNHQISRIRRVFKFAVENELIEVSVLSALQAVQPLLAGRTEAHDNPKRHAVDQDKIEAVKSRVRPLVRDLIDLQILTGARSGELLGLTAGMIDRTNQTWKAVITDHKTVHHGQVRMIPFGPKAQLILTKYLQADQAKRLFKMRREGYCRAITRACELAEIERWTPHWLRHTYATRTREQLGIEAVQSVVGHATTEMTKHYSSQMETLAMKTAQQVG